MKPYRSIHWQLLLWQMLLLAAVLTTLLSLHYHLQRKSLIAETDGALQTTLMKAMPAIAMPGGRPPHGALPPLHPPPESSGPAQSKAVFLEEFEQEDIYLIAWNKSGVAEFRYGPVPPNVVAADFSSFRYEQRFINRDGYRELIVPHHTGILIVIGRPLTEVNMQLAATCGHSLLVGSAVFLLGLIGGRLIIRKALRPIREISKTAEEIAGGDHSRRIELSAAPEELAGLAQTLNNSFHHLDHALKSQKCFSADASHELRTPIAVVMAQTQAALRRDRTTDEYKTVLEACLRAGQRMKAMTDSLLDLTRIDGNDAALAKRAQALNKVVSLAVSDASHLSDLHPVDVRGTDETLAAEIDQERIHQVLMNVITNAIQHNPAGCAIHVSLNQIKETGVIEIADEGSGIPSEALPHIFERFYRADKSRSRAQGGAGLGLSIAKTLVEAHGGRICASSAPGKGAIVAISLPLG